MDIFFDMLQVVNVVDFLRLLDSSEKFLCLIELVLVDVDLGEFNFGVKVFRIDFENLIEDSLLFSKVLLAFIEFEKNVQDPEVASLFKQFAQVLVVLFEKFRILNQ